MDIKRGYFTKRLGFVAYQFSVASTHEQVVVHSDENVILLLVEYDIEVFKNNTFRVRAERARAWSRELQHVLFPNEDKKHKSFIAFKENETSKFWSEYDYALVHRILITESVTDLKVKQDIYLAVQRKDFERLVYTYHVSPEVLSVCVGVNHELVADAFMLREFTHAMIRYRTVWLNNEQAAEILQQTYSLSKERLVDKKLISVRGEGEEMELAMTWAVNYTPTESLEDAYPSWHRFVNSHRIPVACTRSPRVVDRTNMTCAYNQVYGTGTLVTKTLTVPVVWCNWLYRPIHEDLVCRAKTNFGSFKRKMLYRFVQSQVDDSYVCGERIANNVMQSNFSNVHPCGFTDICKLPKGQCAMILIVDDITADWVYEDAAYAVGMNKLICIKVV
jgi:hypothetical protein